MGRAHQERVCQVVHLAGFCKTQLFLQILPHHRCSTGHMRRCHGGTAHQLEAAARLGRGNVAASAAHFRLQLKVRVGPQSLKDEGFALVSVAR